MKVPQTVPVVTDREMFGALHARYGMVSQGNSIRYAVAEHVRSQAGFDAPRCADFLAMDPWPSTGLILHGHEVKVSRSDWLTELRMLDKAEAFKPYMNRWWLVVSDHRIVKDGELPDEWGLMVLTPKGLRAKVVAPQLDPAPMPRTMTAALMRAIQITAKRRALVT